ncbi:hypothetical protein HII31_10106 [Pseudocercospora fuligena]|uniref:ASST-domain-containing protein n=1 Tax=Pseudocercospora fuligena TaxID=685502 RepID=A0A8H6VHN1_9PEZI|nr:hypothetical protein HII31_10106 [Pseudocercospora fuligena]
MRIALLLLWHFQLAIAPSAELLRQIGQVNNANVGSYPVKKFASAKARAPYVGFPIDDPECDDGQNYFISPRGWKVRDPGPMILDRNGEVIWSNHFSNNFGGQAYDLKVQQYQGEDYLTFWLGDDRVRGHGAGHYYMLNSSYNIVRKVSGANGKLADLHEFLVTPEGTAVLIVFEPMLKDVRPAGRKFNDVWNQAIWDCLVQEVNIETGELVFEWRASEHVDMSLSYTKIENPDAGTKEKPYDFIHLNSVEKDEHGNYLISARNMHSILYVDGRTKQIIWTLGGKGNRYKAQSQGHALNMAWQHDARFVSPELFPETYRPSTSKPGTTTRLMTVFDNAALDWDYEYGPSYSRGLLLEIQYPTTTKQQTRQAFKPGDVAAGGASWVEVSAPLSDKDAEKLKDIDGSDPAYTVRVVHEYIHPEHVISSTQGSVQLLPQQKDRDARVLIGYGINAVATEFSGNGTVLCDMHFGGKSSWETGDVQSYRAYKFPWIGRPTDPPAIATRRGNAHFSWNGATEVVEWLLQESDLTGARVWTDVIKVPKTGFETTIPLLGDHHTVRKRYLRVTAIDKDGRILNHGISDHVDRYFSISGLGLTGNTLYLSLAIMCAGSVAVLFTLFKIFRGSSAKPSRKAS